MPTYDYKCSNCGHEFEIFQSMKDDKLTKCPECKKETLKRLIGSGGGLIFKGTGFYLTDYKDKGNSSVTSTTQTSAKKESSSESKEPVSKDTKAESGTASSGDSKKAKSTDTSSSVVKSSEKKSAKNKGS